MSLFRVVAGHQGKPPSCSFDLEAGDPDSALAKVTTALRTLYGSDWWADVAQLETQPIPERGMAAYELSDQAENARRSSFPNGAPATAWTPSRCVP
jgi:hypothetical protein